MDNKQNLLRGNPFKSSLAAPPIKNAAKPVKEVKIPKNERGKGNKNSSCQAQYSMTNLFLQSGLSLPPSKTQHFTERHPQVQGVSAILGKGFFRQV